MSKGHQRLNSIYTDNNIAKNIKTKSSQNFDDDIEKYLNKIVVKNKNRALNINNLPLAKNVSANTNTGNRHNKYMLILYAYLSLNSCIYSVYHFNN
jgi:hypothetical protein